MKRHIKRAAKASGDEFRLELPPDDTTKGKGKPAPAPKPAKAAKPSKVTKPAPKPKAAKPKAVKKAPVKKTAAKPTVKKSSREQRGGIKKGSLAPLKERPNHNPQARWKILKEATGRFGAVSQHLNKEFTTDQSSKVVRTLSAKKPDNGGIDVKRFANAGAANAAILAIAQRAGIIRLVSNKKDKE